MCRDVEHVPRLIALVGSCEKLDKPDTPSGAKRW